MSLRKGTKDAMPQITDSVPDFARMDELYRAMSSVGLAGMSTRELEEWSYLMAESLGGKGDPFFSTNQQPN